MVGKGGNGLYRTCQRNAMWHEPSVMWLLNINYIGRALPTSLSLSLVHYTTPHFHTTPFPPSLLTAQRTCEAHTTWIQCCGTTDVGKYGNVAVNRIRHSLIILGYGEALRGDTIDSYRTVLCFVHPCNNEAIVMKRNGTMVTHIIMTSFLDVVTKSSWQHPIGGAGWWVNPNYFENGEWRKKDELTIVACCR